MIYYFLYELIYHHFKDKEWYLIKALNVFQYVTFRTAYASITALLLSLLFGGKLIEALRRWNIGQQIREEGPQGHMAKRGTPTMGGVLIVGSVTYLNFAVGQADERLRLDRHHRDLAFRGHRFRRRLPEDGETQEPGSNRQTKAAGPIADCCRCLGSAVRLDQIFRERLFVECQYSVSEGHGRSRRDQFHRPDSLLVFHHHRPVGIFKRGEPDGWTGWTGDQRDLHRYDGADGIDLFEQRRALGELSGI